MAKIRLIHWSAAEAAEYIEILRAAGHDVGYDEQVNHGFNKRMLGTRPDAVVIDLSRLPSHGRNVAVYLRGRKATRGLPLVFVGGADEKVDAIRQLIPDAVYTTLHQLKSAIRAAMTNKVESPVVPQQMMERYAGRSSAQKVGIKAGSEVAVFDAPRDYAQVLGTLPDGATLVEEPAEPCAVTVWFAHDPESFLAALPRMRRIAPKTKLWIAWKKKAAAPTSLLSENFVREAAIGAGLVDYKVCALDATWSGLALAPRRT